MIVDHLGDHFMGYALNQIDKRQNEDVKKLSRISSRREIPPMDVFLNHIYNPLIMPPKEIDLAIPNALD
jgi:hypothetical protein